MKKINFTFKRIIAVLFVTLFAFSIFFSMQKSVILSNNRLENKTSSVENNKNLGSDDSTNSTAIGLTDASVYGDAGAFHSKFKVTVVGSSDYFNNNQNKNLEKYSLEVILSGGSAIGTSEAVDLVEDGEQIFQIDNTDASHDYGQVRIRITGTSIVSNPFEFKTTEVHEIDSLINAGIVGTVGPSYVSLTVDVISDSDLNKSLNNYRLELVNSNKDIIGTSPPTLYDEDGTKNFDVTNLEYGHDYGQVCIRVDGTEIISNTFPLVTPSYKITSLTDAQLNGPPETTSASIKVTAVSENPYSSVDVYSLEVVNSDNQVIGTSSAVNLSTDGEKEFEIRDLTEGTDYGMVKVKVAGTNIESNDFSLITKFGKIESLSSAQLVGSPTTSSATIKVDTSINGSSSESDSHALDYSLEVIGSDLTTIGTSDSGILNTDGTKTFNITGLTPGTDYGQVKVRVVDTTIVSNSFHLATPLETIESLTNAKIVGEVKTTSVTLSVTANKPSSSNTKVNNYSLELVDSSNIKIGSNDSGVFNDDGDKSFDIVGLEVGKDYDKVKIRIVGTSIVSNEFSLKTPFNTIGSLSNASVINEPKTTSASITVDAEVASSSSSNFIVMDYSLEVINSSSSVVGISDSSVLNTNGTKTFNITGLTPGTDYGQVKVRIKNETITSNEFSLSTPFDKIGSLKNAALVGEPTFNSAKITVDTKISTNQNTTVDDYSLEVIDNDLTTVGNSDATLLNTDGTKVFNLTNLELGKNYGPVKVRVVGTTITSNSFTLKMADHVIDGISSASLNNEKGVTGDSFFINLTTLINDEDSKSDTFKGYNIIVTANHDSMTNDIVSSFFNQTDYKDNVLLKVGGLKSFTTYSNITVKLEDAETSDSLGSPFLISDEVKTRGEVNLSIDNVRILNSTSNGFNFNIDVSNIEGEGISGYNIVLLSEDNDAIWKSEEQTDVIQQKEFSVDTLVSPDVYYDLRFQLVNSENYDDKYSEVFETNMDISPTDSVSSIVDGSQIITSIKRRSISFSISVSPSNFGDEYCSPYKIGVFTNSNNELPVWTSNIKIQPGEDISFTVNKIKPGTKFNNITIAIVDINTNEKIGNTFGLGSPSTLPFLNKVDMIIIFVTILIFILIIVFLIRRHIKKLELARQHWMKKINTKGYIQE